MGTYLSTCDSGCSHGAGSPHVADYQNTLNSYKLKQLQSHKGKNIMKWRQILQEKISEIPEKGPHWPLLKRALLDHINSSKEDANIEWIINIKLVSYYFPCHSTPFMTKSTIPDSDKEDLETYTLSESHNPLPHLDSNFHHTLTTQLEKTSINERPPLRSHLTQKSNERLSKKSQTLMENAMEGTGKDELRRILQAQLKTKNHIINQLVKIFHRKFEEIFGKDLRGLEGKPYSQTQEDVFGQVCDLTKRFVKVLRKFLMWLYRELVKQFKKILKEEDLRPEYVMEYVSYGALFTNTKTTFSRLIKALIRNQCGMEVEKLQEKFSQKRTLPLQEYDTYLKSSTLFLMNNNPHPYENVTKRISELQGQQNPYEKFESILALECEMLKGLEKYHRTQIELKSQVKGNFGLDMKAPILLYCLVRSQNLDVLVDRVLIDRFVNQDFLSKVQNFTTFAACIDFLLESEEMPGKMEEERMTMIGIDEPDFIKGEDNQLKVES